MPRRFMPSRAQAAVRPLPTTRHQSASLETYGLVSQVRLAHTGGPADRRDHHRARRLLVRPVQQPRSAPSARRPGQQSAPPVLAAGVAPQPRSPAHALCPLPPSPAASPPPGVARPSRVPGRAAARSHAPSRAACLAVPCNASNRATSSSPVPTSIRYPCGSVPIRARQPHPRRAATVSHGSVSSPPPTAAASPTESRPIRPPPPLGRRSAKAPRAAPAAYPAAPPRSPRRSAPPSVREGRTPASAPSGALSARARGPGELLLPRCYRSATGAGNTRLAEPSGRRPVGRRPICVRRHA
jgi:hypothetical protein